MDATTINRQGVQQSLQVSHLEDIPAGYNFNIGKPFLVKNLSDVAVNLQVVMADGSQVTTSFEYGWNPELVSEIINAPSNLQAGY